MRVLSRGTELEILGSSSNGNWFRVRHDNQLGWVATNRVVQSTRLGTTTTTADFRQGPGTSHASMRVLSRGTELEILGSSSNGNWLQVRHDNQLGWVATNRVVQVTRLGVTTTATAYFRQGPGTSHASMRVLSQGTELENLGASADNSWLQVRIGTQLGWVSAMRVSESRKPGRTTVADVRIHLSPDASSTVIRRLPRHQELMIIQRTTATQGWTQVVVVDGGGTHTGWIRTNQVERRTQTRRTRGVGTVPVHTGPGNGFNISRRINTNLYVILLAEVGDWSYVRFDQSGVRYYGWISTIRLAKIHNQVITLSNAEALSYTALVNRDFRLASNFSPNDLRSVNVRSNGNQRLRSTAARSLEDLFQAANRSGHTLIAASGYRSYARQTVVHNNHIANHGLAAARRFSARPGHSEHQLGLAMDISTPGLGGALSSGFSSIPEGRWVRNNAHRFGFIVRYPQNREPDTGFVYEPWHLRFVGVDVATEIFNRGLILEEFLGH